MNKLLLLFTLAPCTAFGQMTYVPDNNFENFLENNGMGDGIVNNDSVLTANIANVTSFNAQAKNISDLTGIEDFADLEYLECDDNQLTSLDVSNNTALTSLTCDYNNLASLDVSNNTALTWLSCYGNQLTSLDVSNNTALTYLLCWENQLTSLDVSNNSALTTLHCDGNQLTSLDVNGATALTQLLCYDNQLTSLDVSNNTALITLNCTNNQLTSLDVRNSTDLEYLWCNDNQLTCLNVKNGNNISMISFNFTATGNPNLTCIEVDDTTYSNANWVGPGFSFDTQTSFSTDCNNPCSSPTGITELPTPNKQLLTITDILGRTTYPAPNTLLFYIYEDGSVEKKMQIER